MGKAETLGDAGHIDLRFMHRKLCGRFEPCIVFEDRLADN
jgi:hypothetical protein